MAGKNGHLRPETVLAAGERKIKMRPTHEALEAIERRCNAGVVELYQRIKAQKPRFSDLAVVIEEGARATGEDISKAEAFDLVQEHMLPCSVACFHFLATAFGPPPESAKPGPPQAT
jgi:hypothetical protein